MEKQKPNTKNQRNNNNKLKAQKNTGDTKT